MSQLNKIIEMTDTLSRVEANLKEEMEILSFVLELSMDGYWDVDFTTGYAYYSNKWKSLLGYADEELENNEDTWKKVIDPDHIKVVEDSLNEHFSSNGDIPFDVNVTYLHKDGHGVSLRCRGKVVTWTEDGSQIRMVGTHQFIKVV